MASQKRRGTLPGTGDRPFSVIGRLFDEHPVLKGLPRIVAYMINLPHRGLRANEVWVKDFGELAIVIEPVRLFLHGDHTGEYQGVPFGPRARVLFAYFLDEAVKNNNLEIERGGISLNHWFDTLGVSIGGKSYSALRDQELRISACRYLTTFRARGYEGAAWDNIYVNGMRDAPGQDLHPGPAHQQHNMVQLNRELYGAITDHPTRVPLEALAQLSNQSLGLDIYFWLAYRLPLIQEPELLTWEDIYRFFGSSYRQLRHFQPRFAEKLDSVLSVYRDARVEVNQSGLTLHSSPPPAPPL